MANEKIEQPSVDLQQILSELMDQKPSVVEVCGKKHSITWLKKGTVRKFTGIMTSEKDPWKRSIKACACVLLNHRLGLRTWFNLHFVYWFYWRWLYYVRDMDQVEVIGVLDASKKKIQSDALVLATIYQTGMMDTMMMMAQHELGRAEPAGVEPSR